MTLLNVCGVNGMLFPAEPVDSQSLIPPPPPGKTRHGRAGTREVQGSLIYSLNFSQQELVTSTNYMYLQECLTCGTRGLVVMNPQKLCADLEWVVGSGVHLNQLQCSWIQVGVCDLVKYVL